MKTATLSIKSFRIKLEIGCNRATFKMWSLRMEMDSDYPCFRCAETLCLRIVAVWVYACVWFWIENGAELKDMPHKHFI